MSLLNAAKQKKVLTSQYAGKAACIAGTGRLVGTILKLLDQVACACASRYARRYAVTLSVDRVMFRQPIHVGGLVTFLASVNHAGTSSMEIGIKVIAEDLRTQVVRHVNSCVFTMVAVDDARKPAPPLRPLTPDEQRRHAAAQVRSHPRQALNERCAALHGAPPPARAQGVAAGRESRMTALTRTLPSLPALWVVVGLATSSAPPC